MEIPINNESEELFRLLQSISIEIGASNQHEQWFRVLKNNGYLTIASLSDIDGVGWTQVLGLPYRAFAKLNALPGGSFKPSSFAVNKISSENQSNNNIGGNINSNNSVITNSNNSNSNGSNNNNSNSNNNNNNSNSGDFINEDSQKKSFSTKELNIGFVQFLELLHQGSFWGIYSCSTGVGLLASKSISTTGLSISQISALEHEMERLSNLKHPNIVQFIGWQKTEYRLDYYMELFIKPFSLYGFIKKKLKTWINVSNDLKIKKVTKGFSYEEIVKYCNQMSSGLAYLHQQGSAHGDLTSASVLIRMRSDQIHSLHLSGNIGTSRSLFKQYQSPHMDSVAFLAPEILLKDSKADPKKADIWSFGMIIYHMLTWELPKVVAESPILPKQVLGNASLHKIITLFHLCVNQDPLKRPSALDLNNIFESLRIFSLLFINLSISTEKGDSPDLMMEFTNLENMKSFTSSLMYKSQPLLPFDVEENTYSDGFTSVFSFGVGAHYVLGNGTEASQLSPISIDSWNKSKVKIIQLACGSTFAMARTVHGQVWSWGEGSYGQLGHSDTTIKKEPTLIASFENHFITHIACGDLISAAISGNGEVFICGASIRDPFKPVDISAKMSKISCGGHFASFLSETGEVYSLLCTKTSETFQSKKLKELALLAGIDVVDKEGGILYAEPLPYKATDISCGSNNLLVCCLNAETQYIFNIPLETVNEKFPSPIEWKLSSVKKVICGTDLTAILTRGIVYTWGNGILGHGSSSSSFTSPRIIKSLKGTFISDIACGSNYVMLIANEFASCLLRCMLGIEKNIDNVKAFINSAKREDISRLFDKLYTIFDSHKPETSLLTIFKSPPNVHIQTSKTTLGFGLVKKRIPLGKTVQDSFLITNKGSTSVPFKITWNVISQSIISITCAPSEGVLQKNQSLPISVSLTVRYPTKVNSVIDIAFSDNVHHFVVIKLETESMLSPMQEINFSEIKLLAVIGTGGLANVYSAIWRDMSVAVKIFHQLWDVSQMNDIDLLRMKQEILLLTQLNHPNVLKFFGAHFQIPKVYIVTELLKSTLYSCIHMPSYIYSDQIAFKFCIDIARGMEYIHSQNVIHRDLKSLNILIDDVNTLKIADFGHSKYVDMSTLSHDVGTLLWRAPEIMMGMPYSFASDIYSFAIIMWEILTAKIPFSEFKNVDIMHKVTSEELRPSVPTNCNSVLKDLMTSSWHASPTKRPTFKNIVFVLLDAQWMKKNLQQ